MRGLGAVPEGAEGGAGRWVVRGRPECAPAAEVGGVTGWGGYEWAGGGPSLPLEDWCCMWAEMGGGCGLWCRAGGGGWDVVGGGGGGKAPGGP